MAVVWLSLLHYFTGLSGFLAYGFVIFRRLRLSDVDVVFLSGLIILLTIHLGMEDPYIAMRDARFFWGWIFFYLIFKARFVSRENLQTVLVLLCLYSLVEAVLINTVISPEKLPNSPGLNWYGGSSHFIGGGLYQRPFSFGGSPSVSSPLLVVLMAFCRVRGWRFWLATFTTLSFFSGVGTLSIMFLLVVRYRLLLAKVMLPFGLVVALVYFWIPDFTGKGSLSERGFTDKVGLANLERIIVEDKWPSTLSVLGQLEGYNLVLGYPRLASEGVGGDFGFLSFFKLNGIFGLSLFLLIVLSRANRFNGLPLIFIIGTSLHYPSMFYLPGQMIFGLLLSISKNGFSGSRKGGVE